MKIVQSILAVSLLAIATASNADNRFFAEAGIHFGGDNLVTVAFIGGGSESINAGELLSGSVGMISDISESLKLRASIGIKFDAISAVNGDISFTRFPLEGMLFTNNAEGFNFGAGITYHLAPELDASGPVLSGNVPFDDALGFVAEVDYLLSEKAYLGFKLTSIDYEIENAFPGTPAVDGNSFGIVIGVSF
ncbi:MAG: hypothetical protein OEY87_10955 [Gammaproteobacteria bacterium]|nr:hypothetical protein [Gammaproteobacteria bacterium]MDH5736630.1 hypothetical protein [Gammaproteobacteria bacterium]